MEHFSQGEIFLFLFFLHFNVDFFLDVLYASHAAQEIQLPGNLSIFRNETGSFMNLAEYDIYTAV